MIAAGQLVHSAFVSSAEVADAATIPVARGRIDGVAPGGGGLSDGAADQPDDPLPGGAVSRELPDELVTSAARGDHRAREKLLALLHPPVLRYCRARLGGQESVRYSADDVAQDVCAAVVSALPTYQVKGLSFRAFVYGIAAHKVADAFRAAGRDRAEPVAELPAPPDTAEGPEHRLLGAERAEHVRALLAHLTPRQREVLVLRLAVGMSAEETAQAVRSSAGAVRVTQHRALVRLRRIIQEGESAARVLDDWALDGTAPDEQPEEPVGDRTPRGDRSHRTRLCRAVQPTVPGGSEAGPARTESTS